MVAVTFVSLGFVRVGEKRWGLPLMVLEHEPVKMNVAVLVGERRRHAQRRGGQDDVAPALRLQRVVRSGRERRRALHPVTRHWRSAIPRTSSSKSLS